jgi:hypothetical protein
MGGPFFPSSNSATTGMKMASSFTAPMSSPCAACVGTSSPVMNRCTAPAHACSALKKESASSTWSFLRGVRQLFSSLLIANLGSISPAPVFLSHQVMRSSIGAGTRLSTFGATFVEVMIS